MHEDAQRLPKAPHPVPLYHTVDTVFPPLGRSFLLELKQTREIHF
jgi:hypothetical protein